jgi:hypothetical protein
MRRIAHPHLPAASLVGFRAVAWTLRQFRQMRLCVASRLVVQTNLVIGTLRNIKQGMENFGFLLVTNRSQPILTSFYGASSIG